MLVGAKLPPELFDILVDLDFINKLLQRILLRCVRS